MEEIKTENEREKISVRECVCEGERTREGMREEDKARERE